MAKPIPLGKLGFRTGTKHKPVGVLQEPPPEALRVNSRGLTVSQTMKLLWQNPKNRWLRKNRKQEK